LEADIARGDDQRDINKADEIITLSE